MELSDKAFKVYVVNRTLFKWNHLTVYLPIAWTAPWLLEMSRVWCWPRTRVSTLLAIKESDLKISYIFFFSFFQLIPVKIKKPLIIGIKKSGISLKKIFLFQMLELFCGFVHWIGEIFCLIFWCPILTFFPTQSIINIEVGGGGGNSCKYIPLENP